MAMPTTPADAKNLASSAILFTNGLGFEGWMDRLENSSGFKGKVVASTGVKPRTMIEDEKKITDPHAWQSFANGQATMRSTSSTSSKLCDKK